MGGCGEDGGRLIRVRHIAVSIPIDVNAHARGAVGQQGCVERHGHAQAGRRAGGKGGQSQVLIISRVVIAGGTRIGRGGEFAVRDQRADPNGRAGSLAHGWEAGVVAVIDRKHPCVEVSHRIARHHREDGRAPGGGVRIAVGAVVTPLVRGAEGEASRWDELQHVIPRCHGRETEDAGGIRRLRGAQYTIAIEQSHGDAAESGLVCILDAIAIAVLPHAVTDEACGGRIVREGVFAHGEEFAVRSIDAETEAKDR